MQAILLCMLGIFIISPATASYNQTDSYPTRVIDSSLSEDMERPEALVSEFFYQSEDISGLYSSIPDRGLDWGSDISVYSIPQYLSGYVRYFDYDYDTANGDLYVSIIIEYYTLSASYMNLYIYRSEDGGFTWNRFYSAGGGAGRRLIDCKIRIIADSSDDSWVIVSSLWEWTTGVYYDLWTARCRTSGGYMTWENVARKVRNNFRHDMDAVASTGPGNAPYPYVYTMYSPNEEWAVVVSRNKLDGSGWTDNDYLTTTIDCYRADIEDAGGGTVAVVFPLGESGTLYDILLARSTDYGETWLPATAILSGIPLKHSFDFAMTKTSSTGWLALETEGESPNNHILQTYYTSNDGYNWTEGDIVDESDDDFDGLSIRCSKTGSAVTLAFDIASYAMFSWSYSYNPSAFTNPLQISDEKIAGYWTNPLIVAGWNGSSSTVLFTYTDCSDVLIDWWSNYTLDGLNELPLAIDDRETASSALAITGSSPNPATSFTSITFSLAENASADIVVYDVAGRAVAVLSENEPFHEGNNSVGWDCMDDAGNPVSAGLYYCRMTTDSACEIHSLVVVR